MDDLIHRMQVTSFTDADVTYTVDPSMNTCTCMKWKYQRLPVGQRTCKHLDSVRVRSERLLPSITLYPTTSVEDTYFQLVTHHIPTTIEAYDYVYSIKYDGIRVRINGNRATTRGGIVIDISGLKLPFVTGAETEYDAELIHTKKPGHNHVMIELYANRLENLSVKVFDIIDTTLSFAERQTIVKEHVEAPFLVEYHPIHDRTHLSTVVKAVLAVGEEGIVVRRCNGTYRPGRRSRYNAFKVKRNI
jgi:hypothetical protein